MSVYVVQPKAAGKWKFSPDGRCSTKSLLSISFRILRLVVDLMLIIGGAEDKYLNPSARHLDYEIVTPKGQKCQTTFPTLPDMPANLKHFGLASRKDRYLYLCGGNYLQYTGRKF